MSVDNKKNVAQKYLSALEKPWSETNEKILMGPYTYLLAQPGKDIRKQLIEAFNRWLQVPEEALEIIIKVIAMLHTASLLIDDVEDNSFLRRGEPVAHNIFGVPQTINSANYVYFVALEEIGKLNNPEAMKIYYEELINLHRGQGMDLHWRESLTVPTEEEYLEMVNYKTGGLFRLAWKLMFASSTSEKDFVKLVNVIGLLFQIHDDYMNLQSATYTQNKGFAEDLTEGKFSFPIIHSIRADTSNQQLLNILKRRTQEHQVKEYAVKYMKEQTESFEYTKKVIHDLDIQARALIEEYGGNESLLKILDKFNVWDK